MIMIIIISHSGHCRPAASPMFSSLVFFQFFLSNRPLLFYDFISPFSSLVVLCCTSFQEVPILCISLPIGYLPSFLGELPTPTLLMSTTCVCSYTNSFLFLSLCVILSILFPYFFEQLAILMPVYWLMTAFLHHICHSWSYYIFHYLDTFVTLMYFCDIFDN